MNKICLNQTQALLASNCVAVKNLWGPWNKTTMFSIVVQLDGTSARGTTHLKFDPTGVQTHDPWIKNKTSHAP